MSETLELLAPARNAEIGRTAILAGADAVYIGAPAFGARAAAGNSVADIAALAEFAHRYRARVYVTMNTIVYTDELAEVSGLCGSSTPPVWTPPLQDMAYLELPLPPIASMPAHSATYARPRRRGTWPRPVSSQLVLPARVHLSTKSRQRRRQPGYRLKCLSTGLCA